MAITFSGIPGGLIASAVGIENVYKRSGRTPAQQRIALLGQYLAAKTPTDNLPVSGITSADDIALLAGYGSQSHMMAVTLFAEMGSSPIAVDWFPIADGTTAQVSTVTFASNAGAAGIWRLYILGKKYEISVAAGDTPTTSAAAMAAAITADLFCPFTAAANVGVVTLTAKWKGLSSAGLDIRKNYYGGDTSLAPTTQTMVIASGTAGAGDPSLATALANFGSTFYTMIVTALNDATAAGAIESAFTSRIEPLVKKPVFGVLGYVGTRANFLTALASRNSPGSVYFPVEGSPSHPGQISAACVAKFAVSAAADASRPWKNIVFDTLLPGSGAPWTLAQAQSVELAGGSTFDVTTGGKIKVWDALTTYKTNAGGASDDSWRYPETITNTQYKLNDLDVMLASPPFDRAKIISDTDVAASEYAISPRTMRAYFYEKFDQWVNELNHSRNAQTMKDSLNIEVDGGNPSRMNVEFTDYMVSGLRIVAVKRNWTFGA